MSITSTELFGVNKGNILNKGTIIYIGGFELPDKNAAAHRVVSNGKLLRDLGYKVVFHGVTKDTDTNNLQIPRHFFDFDCYSRKYPVNLKQWLKYFTSIEDYKNVINQFNDVKAVICYNMPSWPLYNLKLFCNKRGIKIISDCTEWYKGSLKGNFTIGLIKRFDSILRMYYVQKKLDGIISISEYLHSFYNGHSFKAIKVPPLIDYKDVKWINPLASNDKIKIVYAGGAFSSKDSYVKDRLDLVIQALSYFKQNQYSFNFNVVGCDLDDFKNFYPLLVKDVNILGDSVIFHGRLSHEEAINLIKNADFSIFLRDESIVTKAGFPTKFVESITCGTPVLTNDNSNVYDYLEHAKNGFRINSDTLETIKESLIEPLSINPHKLMEMRNYTYNAHIFDYRIFKKEFDVLLN